MICHCCDISAHREPQNVSTMKPVYNDHLYNKMYYHLIDSVMCLNEDWMNQFTLANDFCLLELI